MTDHFTTVLASGLVLFLFAGFLGLGFWIKSARCHSQWNASGFQTDWGPIQGCLISKDGKIWIPAINYRELAD